ncbi:PIN-like domain-containing protein [Pseudomonas sp. BF-R-30]|uniref:PIN-like domain-containing protein n=1 Tax=Pseudomonas sp. BF-R-30 TaxID=2832384 RepID=UPI001CBDD496|nr:PIN domain-containing protein [Pseudomonas sp. BF-R-30]
MREAFSEHFVGEPERQQKLWADCIFVLDTNVLLDLYRFSDSAREALFKVMESLGERLWIPYQVAAEYFENRLTVIEAQSKAYAESISGLKVAKEKFNSGSRHPFVSDVVFNQFISSYDLMIKELETKQETYLSYVGNDVIKTKIGTLLNGRVGQPYSEERLLEVAVEGEKRYLENIPPGFQDCGKMPEATTNKLRLKKFGDLILWKQVIEKAVAANKSVILVTGEKKDDWWLKSNKGLVSALPALTKEFMDAAKQDFYLYATDRFLLKANDYLAQSTSAVVVEEVRAINKADADLNDNLESALLDQAINVVWPEIPPGSSWISAKSWADRAAMSPWHQRPTTLSRNSALSFAMKKREFIRGKIHALRARLDALRAERDELMDLRESLFASGVTLEDERFERCKAQMLTIDTMISAHEVEFAGLRDELHSVNAHYNVLLSDDADE